MHCHLSPPSPVYTSGLLPAFTQSYLYLNYSLCLDTFVIISPAYTTTFLQPTRRHRNVSLSNSAALQPWYRLEINYAPLQRLRLDFLLQLLVMDLTIGNVRYEPQSFAVVKTGLTLDVRRHILPLNPLRKQGDARSDHFGQLLDDASAANPADNARLLLDERHLRGDSLQRTMGSRDTGGVPRLLTGKDSPSKKSEVSVPENEANSSLLKGDRFPECKTSAVLNKRPSLSLPAQRDGSSIHPRQPGLTKLGKYDTRCAGLLLLPETKPISRDQLVSEVKSIYAGLTMVERECIQVDKLQAAAIGKDTTEPISDKVDNNHWQALIALHRTLLHEHHDFLVASRHPSATAALRRLAAKYSMPARMWKNGIQSFLELLRRRLPDSLDHMLSFIYLAYQMMALLHETIPALKDTWVECLGDLGRYRMTIEGEDVRDRETWAGVAKNWYSRAADRNPNVGRLYHHLAILSQPNALRQLYHYSRSLTCVRPFASARESISTLLDPIMERSGSNITATPIDTSFIQAHGALFEKASPESLEHVLLSFQSQLDAHIGRVTTKWKEQRVYTDITNIAGLFNYDDKGSVLRQVIEDRQATFKKTQAISSMFSEFGLTSKWSDGPNYRHLVDLLYGEPHSEQPEDYAPLWSACTDTYRPVDISKDNWWALGNERVPRGQRRQRYIPLSMRDQEIHAFPDNGSELDVVSRRFAKKHQLAVDGADVRTVVLPNGRKISTKGTVTLRFRFTGEKENFRRTFHVLKNSIHDVILGRSFLEATETLGLFMHRIKTKAASWFSRLPRVHLLGSIAPRVSGSINGALVNAVDDIGSDVNVISLKEARRLGLDIQTGEAYRTLLGFADGSHAFTYGTVVGSSWRFGMDASSEPIKIDLHVLQDLNCDVILSNDFLFDNNAYSSHIPLYPLGSTLPKALDEPAGFGMIMELSNEKSLLDSLVAWFRWQPTSADPESVDSEAKARRELNREVARQLYHQERIESLSQAEQQGEWQAEKARRRKWADDFTIVSATVPASQASSSIGLASGQHSGAAAVPPKGRFGIRRIGKALKSLNGG
ncbi:hypothetical protein J1614_010683 [Plenodomus biglobosus]|nr:hypothetical protein J1614_010683 [Plenodomus biglobosus]